MPMQTPVIGWLGWLTFTSLTPGSPIFFGFGQYLAGLALMVLAWTIADVRYRFRVATAPVAMDRLTFTSVAAIGVLVLLTDLWRAQGWPVPAGPIPPAVWQAILGGWFLLTFLAWAWFGFIRPPTYGKWNAKRYAESLYRTILKGSPTQLAVAADELSRSADALVQHASNYTKGERSDETQLDDVTAYANTILFLIADRRFCRVVVNSSPNTIGALFSSMRRHKKYGIDIEVFGRNVVREAIRNRDSFLYHESSGYDSGLLGYDKPLTMEVFSDYNVIDANMLLVDPGYFEAKEWGADQWRAYCRIVLIVLRAYAERGDWWGRSFALHQATELLANALDDLYKLDGVASPSWDDDIQARLRVVVDFVGKAVEILDEVGVPKGISRRTKTSHRLARTIYDELAELIAKIVLAAAAVTTPQDLCWWIQHNNVWTNLTWHDTPAWRAVLFKVRRLLYDDIVHMSRFPNFKGARILGFCLNVMRFTAGASNTDRQMRPLHRAVLAWTKANFSRLHEANPRVAEACLVDGIAYDRDKSRLVRTYPAGGLQLEPNYTYLVVDPAKPPTSME